jgi:hypothetical protein
MRQQALQGVLPAMLVDQGTYAEFIKVVVRGHTQGNTGARCDNTGSPFIRNRKNGGWSICQFFYAMRSEHRRPHGEWQSCRLAASITSRCTMVTVCINVIALGFKVIAVVARGVPVFKEQIISERFPLHAHGVCRLAVRGLIVAC